MPYADTPNGRLYYDVIDLVAPWETRRETIVFHHVGGTLIALYCSLKHPERVSTFTMSKAPTSALRCRKVMVEMHHRLPDSRLQVFAHARHGLPVFTRAGMRAAPARVSLGHKRAMTRFRIGIDVGGTFTDLFLLDQQTGAVARHKLLSTPGEPHLAPLAGIREILSHAGGEGAQVAFVGLGTTVMTNALLERKGAMTGLITTAGFRDLLEIARQKRPHTFDPFVSKPEPLVPRQLRVEVVERMAADGSVFVALDRASLDAAIERLLGAGVQTIAICFLNSYANPAHEQEAARAVRARWPAGHISVSVGCAARISRVRAAELDDRQRVPDAGDAQLSAALRSGSRVARDSAAAVRHEFGRRHHDARAGRRAPDRHAFLGAERRRQRRGAREHARGPPQHHHLRHGRHQHRRVPRAGRQSRS